MSLKFAQNLKLFTENNGLDIRERRLVDDFEHLCNSGIVAAGNFAVDHRHMPGGTGIKLIG